jgi:ferrochelatase
MSIHGASSHDSPRYDTVAHAYDAILVMSFGGPEGYDDVMPFLERVVSGRNVPRERLLAVAEHYYAVGGVSPINEQNRAVIARLRQVLADRDINLPIYFGNRNWHPLVGDTIAQMQSDGIREALTFVTSGFSCYSGCRQYREDIISACNALHDAPRFDKIRTYYNHPRFIAAQVDLINDAIAHTATGLTNAKVLFTAHSIPVAMARQSAYEAQLNETSRLIADAVGIADYALVFQSRSGAPHVPWLEPDINDAIHAAKSDGFQHVYVMPIGFMSDHMEVINDLDHEAQLTAQTHAIGFSRVATVAEHPQFIEMIADLIEERLYGQSDRPAVGHRPANHDVCPLNCCLAPSSAPARTT